MSSAPTELRPLGLHERYCLARANLGHPACVCIVARVRLRELLSATTADAGREPRSGEHEHEHELIQRTRARIAHAFAQYPLLRSGIAAPQSKQPRWRKLAPSVDDVLRVPRSPLPPAQARAHEGMAAALIQSEHAEWKALARAHSESPLPLWRVAILSAPDAEAWLILLCDHTIADGMGTFRLFQLLFSTTPCSLDREDCENEHLPPTSDEVFPMAPSVPKLGKMVLAELLWPKVAAYLPSWISPSHWFGSSPPRWPGESDMNPDLGTVLADRPGLTTLMLPGTLSKVKQLAREHGIRGLHALLHTLALVALHTILHKDDDQPLVLQTATPMSVRNHTEKVPYTTGNFVASVEWTGSVTADDHIWRLASEFGTFLTSPTTQRDGLQNVGMLGYVPSDPPGGSSFPTGWEAYLQGKFTLPPGVAMELSNLGLLPLCSLEGAPGLAGVQALAWAQAPQPSGAGINLDFCGVGDTLCLSIGLREKRYVPELQARLEQYFAPMFKAALLALLALPRGKNDLSVSQLGRIAWAAVEQS